MRRRQRSATSLRDKGRSEPLAAKLNTLQVHLFLSQGRPRSPGAVC